MLSWASTKQLDTSTKQYNLSHWKATTKQIFSQIKINKLQVHKILRSKKRLQVYMEMNKNNGMVMLLSMNTVNYYVLQPLNVRVEYNK